jgi:hypothetical protein
MSGTTSPVSLTAVFFVRPDENIQVLGCSWLCVYAKSIAAYDKIFNCVVVECA